MVLYRAGFGPVKDFSSVPTPEETGITCEITGLVGTCTDPRYVILYTSNGEARQEFSIVLTGRAAEGEPTSGDESREVRRAPREEVETLAVDRSMRLRIGHFLAGRAVPHIG
ncbi:hypothetical protein SAMN05216275_11531 [Streptosporangium canum]|uniref:Uncharacterized protein n=1 Tax=Streptosporangium canum TaxID=324952 RepID=A0A1I3VV71_9ACTN|nr:hypothetical protein [Streptosporangium canum]SFJ99049.1 hypothetical protein SAMN05216275_11531 [Streptosporangium canum]